MRFVLFVIAIVANLASRAAAHSWVHCTEAQTSLTIKSNSDYSDTKCSGYPRNFKQYVQYNSIFGGDTGFNYQPGSGDPICRDAYSASTSYSSAYPMATYAPGQNVRVIWPAKNHQADTCTNPYIPDTAMKLFMDCSLDGTRKPTTKNFLAGATLVVDWKANGGKGFQNCPDFCNSPDKAVCYEDFTVPHSVPVGSTCTFVWYWIFNSGDTNAYTTCWEAQIVSSTSNPGSGTTTPAPSKAPTKAPSKAPSKAPTSGTPAPTSTTTKSPTTKAPTTGGGSGGSCSATVWQQCGGNNFNGPTCCTSGNKCVFLSEWYSQCWPNTFDAKADQLNSTPDQAEHSKTTLILMFLGSAIGAAAVVLTVGVSIIYFRRRKASANNADASEVFIPMQTRE